jgi:EmrB/QacA subfamily drug resistance transporter
VEKLAGRSSLQLDRRRRAAILALCCATGAIHVTGLTSTNIALPSIQRDLGLSDAVLPWVVGAYSISFAGVVLLGGRMADLFGHRRMYLVGTLVFAGAAVFAVVFDAAGPIVVARALQGVGAALATPAALAVLTTTFPREHERSRALALWTSSAASGAALGLVLGGLLTSVLGWRWVFLVSLPLCVAMIGGALALLPGRRPTVVRRQLDLAGATTITGALVLFVLGLTLAEQHGWTASIVAGSFAGSVGLLALFAAIELKSTAPLVPLQVFRLRGLRAACILSLVQSAVTFAVAVVTSLYLQRGLGYSALAAGLAFLPLDAAVIAGSAISHRLVRRFGVRVALACGGVMLTAGPLWMGAAPTDYYATSLLPGIAVLGLGTGLVSLPTSIVAFAGVPRAEAGLASGLLTATRQIGVVFGATLLGTVLASSTSGGRTAGVSGAQAIADGASNAYLVGACLAATSVLVGLALVRQPAQAATAERPVDDQSLPIEV